MKKLLLLLTAIFTLNVLSAQGINSRMLELTEKADELSMIAGDETFVSNPVNLVILRKAFDSLLKDCAEEIAKNPPQFELVWSDSVNALDLTEQDYNHMTISYGIKKPFFIEKDMNENAVFSEKINNALKAIPQSCNWGSKINGFPWTYANETSGDNWLKKAGEGEAETLNFTLTLKTKKGEVLATRAAEAVVFYENRFSGHETFVECNTEFANISLEKTGADLPVLSISASEGKNVSLLTREAYDQRLVNEKIAEFKVNCGTELYPVMESVPGKNYKISNSAVTKKLFDAVMGESSYGTESEENNESESLVENVNWYDAVYFCNLLSEIAELSPVYSVNGKSYVKEWGYTPLAGEILAGNIDWNKESNGYRLADGEEWNYVLKNNNGDSENHIYLMGIGNSKYLYELNNNSGFYIVCSLPENKEEAKDSFAEHIVEVKKNFEAVGGEKLYPKMTSIPGRTYKIATTEITQKLYTAVMGENPSFYKKAIKGEKANNLPIENVNWYDAVYFCNLLSEFAGLAPVYSVNGTVDVTEWGYTPHKGESIAEVVEWNRSADGYRLPAYEEWVYAAQGGQNLCYSGSDILDEAGWYNENSGKRTHEVGLKNPNGYGIYDLSGNVWEWSWDSSAEDETMRYRCGGSLNNKQDFCAIDKKFAYEADKQNFNVGFRVVCSTYGEKADPEQIAAMKKAEQNLLAAEKAEQERLAAEKAEQVRIAAEKAEQERLAAEKAEQERLAAEKAEQERIAAEKAEEERLAAEKAEQERLAAEKAEQERLEAERVEQERIAANKITFDEHIAKMKKNFETSGGERLYPEMAAIPEQNYKMAVTEVTQKLYTAVMGKNPSKFKTAVGSEDKNYLPVEQVSWYDAVYFCNLLSEYAGLTPVYSVNDNIDVTEWGYTPHQGEAISEPVDCNMKANGYRLPTKDEWLFAGKAGKNYKFSGSDKLNEVGWYVTNSEERTHEVAKKKGNAYGIYDMSGNVCEWIWDADTNSGATRNYRGGGYDYSLGACGVISGKNAAPTTRNNNLGFRVVCTAD